PPCSITCWRNHEPTPAAPLRPRRQLPGRATRTRVGDPTRFTRFTTFTRVTRVTGCGPALEPGATDQARTARQVPAEGHPLPRPRRHRRVRGAILPTNGSEGPRTLSQFIHRAVMAEVERLERTYNNGRPFPPIGPHGTRE